ncbi:MAG: choline dehydrogenase-like flavoprotein [Pedosphaera sp.]|nr:choline dehydrogenase-like flavoprotein [Pedosphaera sp.]
MHCVVGSGPSGIACAQALLARGLTVRMLDVGLTLEKERARAVEQLSASAPAGWDPQLVALLKGKLTSGAKGMPDKLVYGSDFPYREVETQVPGAFDGVGLKPSLALGGLSNVWGAAMMPYIDADLTDWPIGTAELSEHYAAALKLTGLAARRDDLASIFPLHVEEPGRLELNSQLRAIWGSLERNKATLTRQGIHYGAARVAIRAQVSKERPGCNYCGMCMYGCPYGYIYNSATTVKELQKHERFTYQPDVVVTSCSETREGVTIFARDRKTGQEMKFEAERLYLAAGTIPTTKLLLESRQCYDQTLEMKDSQYFLVPMLLGKRVPYFRTEALYTLSQLFLEIFDAEISPHSIHLQLYPASELISDAVRKALGKFGLNFNFLATQLEQRLVVAQGFLHSKESSTIATTLRRTGTGAELSLQAQINPQTRSRVRKVAGKLMRNMRNLGAAAVLPMVEIAEPGRSFHSGGTFPMRKQPGPFETDILGRPFGWQRIHAVDATILPSIPATTITLSVMANAHRIAWESAKLT